MAEYKFPRITLKDRFHPDQVEQDVRKKNVMWALAQKAFLAHQRNDVHLHLFGTYPMDLGKAFEKRRKVMQESFKNITWTENIYAVLAMQGSKVHGFSLYRTNHEERKSSLVFITVHKKSRGNKIGTKLLQETVQNVEGIFVAEIPNEDEKLASRLLNWFQKSGFNRYEFCKKMGIFPATESPGINHKCIYGSYNDLHISYEKKEETTLRTLNLYQKKPVFQEMTFEEITSFQMQRSMHFTTFFRKNFPDENIEPFIKMIGYLEGTRLEDHDSESSVDEVELSDASLD